MKPRNIIPVFVPHIGCPHDCAFCNQKKITQQEDVLDFTEIYQYIEKYIDYFSKNKESQIAFYGGSFTGIPKEQMIQYLEIGKSFISDGRIDSLRLSTRPDFIDEEILEILLRYGVKTIELGVQSMDNEVLEANQRGHSAEDVVKAVNLIHEYNFELGLQMMIGLYRDSIESSFFSSKEIIKLNPNFVRIYPTLVLRDTYLEEMYKNGEYQPLDLKTAIIQLKKIIPLFYEADIPIIRIGLQPSDEIKEGGSVIAGPFHPGIRALVEEEIYYEKISRVLKTKGSMKSVKITAPHSKLNYIVGTKGKNKKKWKDDFALERIVFRGENRENIHILIDDSKNIIFDHLEKNI